MAYYYLVDFENVHLRGLEGVETLSKADRVIIYCRKEDIGCIRRYLSQNTIRASVEGYIVKETTKNAVDFNLVADMFRLKRRSGGVVYIISNDKGFDVAVNYALSQKIFCTRSGRIADAKINYEIIMKYGIEKERIVFL